MRHFITLTDGTSEVSGIQSISQVEEVPAGMIEITDDDMEVIQQNRSGFDYIDGVVVARPPRPFPWHAYNWIDNEWVFDDNSVDDLRDSYIDLVNGIAAEKITGKYPIHKQMNNIGTPEYDEMREWIDNIRFIASSAKIQIKELTSKEEMDKIYEKCECDIIFI